MVDKLKFQTDKKTPRWLINISVLGIFFISLFAVHIYYQQKIIQLKQAQTASLPNSNKISAKITSKSSNTEQKKNISSKNDPKITDVTIIDKNSNAADTQNAPKEKLSTDESLVSTKESTMSTQGQASTTSEIKDAPIADLKSAPSPSLPKVNSTNTAIVYLDTLDDEQVRQTYNYLNEKKKNIDIHAIPSSEPAITRNPQYNNSENDDYIPFEQ